MSTQQSQSMSKNNPKEANQVQEQPNNQKENKDNNQHPQQEKQEKEENQVQPPQEGEQNPENPEEKKEEVEEPEPEYEPKTTELSKINIVPLARTDFSMEITKKWSRLIARGPPKRRSCHSSFLYKNKYLYIIGGVDITERKQNDIYRIKLNAENHQWEKVETKDKQLEKIAYHSGVEYNGIYYIIGGQDETLSSSNVIQKFNVEEAIIEEPITPDETVFPPLESHTSDLHGATAIIFGGHTNKKYNKNVYCLNFEDGQIASLTDVKDDDENVPKPRQSHSSLIYQDNLYIFGGYGPDETYYNDMWMFSITGKTFSQIKFDDDLEHCPGICPQGRSGMSMVEIGGMFYIFGGKIGLIKESNELWRFNPGTSKFELLHDTLIEKFTPEELEKTKKISEEQAKTKKPFRLLTRHEVEQRTNPLPFSLKNSKNKKRNKDKGGNDTQHHNTSFTDNKTAHSNEVLSRPNVTKMKKSLIYTSSGEELHNALNQLGEDEKAMLDKESTLIIGEVPEPRDGQSVIVYKGTKLLLFGGDRNKFPFNDLYFFDTEGVSGVILENTYQPPEEEKKEGENEEGQQPQQENGQNPNAKEEEKNQQNTSNKQNPPVEKEKSQVKQ